MLRKSLRSARHSARNGGRQVVIALAAAAAAVVLAGPAAGQVVCGDRNKVSEKLTDDHREVTQGQGLTHDGRLVELFASPDGTWTIVITMPSQGPDAELKTCLVAHGESWQPLPPAIAKAFENPS